MIEEDSLLRHEDDIEREWQMGVFATETIESSSPEIPIHTAVGMLS